MKKVLYFILLLMSLFIVSACDDVPQVEGLQLSYNDTEIEMTIGDTINVKPNVQAGAGVTDYTLEYLLSNNYAEIDEEGNLTAKRQGTVVVYVSALEYSEASAELTIVINNYLITLDVNGGNALEEDTISFINSIRVTLPTPVRDGYVFLGWYENDVLVTYLENKNYDLVAKWRQADLPVEVTYELEENVYLSSYSNKTELINDLINDLQRVKGTTYNLSYFTSLSGSGSGIFASSKGTQTFFSNSQMLEKWSWLIDYTKALREADGNDVSQYDNLKTNGYVSTASQTINLELVAFISGRKCTATSNNVTYVSTDYSDASKYDGIWTLLDGYYKENNEFVFGSYALKVLPKAVKNGQVFAGWYTSSDLSAESKVTSQTILKDNITLYPKFVSASESATVTFNYKGGASEEIYLKYGTKLTSLQVSNYNGAFWSGTPYKTNIFISTSGTNDPKATFSTRIYIGRDASTGFYKVISVLASGTASTWPTGAEYVITISGEYSGSYDDDFTASKATSDAIVVFDKDITTISSSSVATMYFFEEKVGDGEVTETIYADSLLAKPIKTGYTFAGWYDDNNNKYETGADFAGLGTMVVYAKWKFQDHLIGVFKTNSWVTVGETIELDAEYLSGEEGTVMWTSKTPAVATVDQDGVVKGVSEGEATIVATDFDDPNINFTFYVTVFASAPTGILKLLAESNNPSIYTRDQLLIGIRIGSDGAYYSDIIGSVSKLLFTDYVVHKDFYLSSPSNKTTLSSGGVQFITVHYAADMPYSKNYSLRGGYNLASYNKSCNTNGTGASWHYSVGNDGVWACQSEDWGAWHAGTSKTMTWYASGVTTAQVGTNIYTTDVTLGSDGYFYLKGIKTSIKNTSGGSKLNGMGLGVKLEGSQWYIGGCFNSTSYGYIGSLGGNNNSIGMETSVREGSDLWLTWQYTAQLCAQLLLKYNLPIQRLVGHHFFTGKWCPQPMLENDLEIWYEFVELVRQQMVLYDDYANYTIKMATDSTYLKANGRVASLPKYAECVKYTVTYTTGGVSKTVTLSTILPGSEK